MGCYKRDRSAGYTATVVRAKNFERRCKLGKAYINREDRYTQIEVSEIDNRLNYRALQLIDEAIQKHGTLDISVLLQNRQPIQNRQSNTPD